MFKDVIGSNKTWATENDKLMRIQNDNCKFECPKCGHESEVTNLCRPQSRIGKIMGEIDYKGHSEAVYMICKTHKVFHKWDVK